MLLYKEKNLHFFSKFHFSYFSFPFHCCQLLCRPVWASKQGSTYNFLVLRLVGILKEISLEENPLNNYLSVQEDLFFDAKVSYSKVNKVRGHLLSQYAILEIGLLIALITSTLLSETFSSCLGETLNKIILIIFFLLSLFRFEKLY